MPQAVRQAVSTESAPAAIGPYSQAIRAGHVAIRVGPDPARSGDGGPGRRGHRRPDTPRLRQPSRNPRGWRRILRSRRPHDGLPGRHERLPAMNEVYATYFSSPAPARATVQAARLPKDARIEIDVIASLHNRRSGRSFSERRARTTSRRVLRPALPRSTGAT